MDLSNRQLGPYKIDREIGQGGMATLYHAIDQRDNGEVALKVLLPHLARDLIVLRRFQKEGENGQRLRHPNITPVLESGEIDGYYYMALPFAANGSLDRQLQRRKQRKTPMSVEDAIALLRPVAAALDYAHARGILHRDIKPSNVLIDADEQVLLSDFGIARRLDPTATQLTMTHTTVGTPAYMSPEQAEGDREIDERADIYSLGVMAYEMLTNELPFAAPTPTKLLQKILEEPPQAPESFNPELPPGISYALRRVLSKAPDKRYDSASEFINALERGLTWSPRPSDWATLTPTSQPAAKRHYRVVEDPVPAKSQRPAMLGIVLGVFGLALIGFGAYSFINQQKQNGTPTVSVAAIATETETAVPIATATATTQPEAQVVPTLTEEEESDTATLTATALPTNTALPTVADTPEPNLTATAAVLQAAIETAVAATAEVRFVEMTRTAEAVQARATATATHRATSTPVPQQPADTPIPSPTRTATATPKPAPPECVSAPGAQFTSILLRDRPWNSYNQLATIPRGHTAQILETYQNNQGEWFHIRYNGQDGWAKQDICQATGTLVDIPAANAATVPGPLPTPTLPPTNTPNIVVTPTSPPAKATPKPSNLFFRGQLMGCKATSVGTFFEGIVYVNGQPADGYRVVFRSSKGSGPATAPVISGVGHNYTAQGDLNWPAGYYKHVIQGGVQNEAKTWVVWLVDEKGKAISDELFWNADGPGNGCNYATVNFYAGN